MRLALQHHARKLKSPRTLHFHVHSDCVNDNDVLCAPLVIHSAHTVPSGKNDMENGQVGKYVKEMKRRCCRRRRCRRNTHWCVNFFINFLLHLEWNKKRLQATASRRHRRMGVWKVASGTQKNDVADTVHYSDAFCKAMSVGTTQSVLWMRGRICFAWNTSPVESLRIESLAISHSLSNG